MPLVPMRLGEKLRIVLAPTSRPGQRDSDKVEAEQWRIFEIAKRRKYVAGEQYDDENLKALTDAGLDPWRDRLPEHKRKHAYSTQIEESVWFIASQLGDSFEVAATAPAVQDVIDNALQLSSQLSGSGDADDVTVTEVLADALIAGDVPVQLRWDDTEQSVFYDLWEAEAVRIDWIDRDTMGEVGVTEVIWVDDEHGGEKQVVQETVYTVETRVSVDFERVWRECRKRVWWDDQDRERDDPMLDVWTGYPFMPWGLLRARTKGLRASRGGSAISDQSMAAADRYNAAEQSGWLITRYNSSGNIVVVGDAANLKLERDGVLSTDVGDVLTFPGGTSVEAIKLPTETDLIEHQRAVLAEQIYNTFGLTRVEPDTIQGLGAVSGYALEILNRKTEGTFERIRARFRGDLRVLFSKTLDLYDALVDESEPVDDDFDIAEPDENHTAADGGAIPEWAIRLTDAQGEEVDPDEGRFPDTEIEIRLGTGYIVDDVQIRDDYQAGLISRREALRKRGYDDEDIAKIEKELSDQQAATGGESGRFSTQAGRTVTSTQPGSVTPET